jgi:hypothetical protein
MAVCCVVEVDPDDELDDELELLLDDELEVADTLVVPFELLLPLLLPEDELEEPLEPES